MKKVLFIIWVIAIIVFFIDWGIVGISFLNGNYEIKAGIYIGLVCFIIICVYPFYKLFNDRCPYCGKMILLSGKYCSYCGKEIKK